MSGKRLGGAAHPRLDSPTAPALSSRENEGTKEARIDAKHLPSIFHKSLTNDFLVEVLWYDSLVTFSFPGDCTAWSGILRNL